MGNQTNHKYVYNGPVMSFDTVLVRDWSASTFAPTEKKARSNLAFQFKRQTNRSASSNIRLPGTIERADREEQTS